MPDQHRRVEPDFAGLVVFDDGVEILLRVNLHLLRALFILEAKLVEIIRAALLGAAGFETAARLMLRQLVGGHVFVVVETADDHGLIRISLDKGDEDFVSDTRPE